MKPLIAVLVALGVGSAATATTVVLEGDAEPYVAAQERQRPGPDSARVAALFASLAQGDPVACEMIADQIGNFWWSDGGIGVGRFSDERPSSRLGKDSVSGPVTDTRAIRLLTSTLANDDPCIRIVAAKMLGNSNADDAVIIAAVESSSPRVREAALRAAGERDRFTLRQRVERSLGDEADVAAMAAWALGEYEQSASLPALRRVLTHASPRVRAAAAYALGQIEDQAAAEDLERLLGRESDRRVKLATIRALGDIEAQRSAPALERVIEGGDVELAIAAAESYANLDIEEGPASPALLRAVESPSRELRYAALEALFQTEDERLAPVFIKFIRDEDPQVRMRVIEALGSMGATEAIAAIKRALEDPDPEVRRAAVEALAEIDDR